MAELAVSASVPQLGRVLSRYAFDPPTGDDPDPEPDPAPDADAGPTVTRTWFRSGGGAGVG